MSVVIVYSVNIPDFASGHFVQFVADNVDHNMNTTGWALLQPFRQASRPAHQDLRTPIPRVTVSAEDLDAVGRINIHHFSATNALINDLVYQRLLKVDVEDATSNVDLLWKTSLLLRSPRPCWSGVMQHVQHGLHPEPSTIDLTCIYSTLKFVCVQTKRLGVTPILTFDQPLWWKAILIVSMEPQSSDLLEIVFRLGGLHMEMSFLGCIGHLMAGSGLIELLEVIYASNVVDNMLARQ